MQSESAAPRTGNWLSDPSLSQVGVVVCTASSTLEGTTYRMREQRLLDSLSAGFVANAYRMGREFLPLTGVQIYLPKGKKESMAYTFVMKPSILFVAERDGGQPELDVLQRARKWGTKAKMPLLTRIWIPPYTLVGRVYVAIWQELAHVLDGEEVFLPMTGVEVTPALPTGESTFNFVAVNKGQIVRVGDPPRDHQALSVAEHKVSRPKQKVAVAK